MAGLILRQAVETDHLAIEELFRTTPMGSQIRIGFERDPDYFAGARVQATEPSVWGAFEANGRAVGILSAGSRRVWLDGERPMCYLSDLRIHPDFQGSSLLARGFRLLRHEVFQSGEWAQTLVLEGNPQALDLLTSQRGGLPQYRPAGRYVSWLLPFQRIHRKSNIQVRTATDADLVEMQELLDASSRRRSFSEILNLADLGKASWRDLVANDFLIAEKNGTIVGMLGLWDQSRFQRLRVKGYSPALTLLRPFWNTWSQLHGGIPLPRAGDVLPLRKATAIACQNDDPEILRALLAMALAGNDKRLLLLGLSAKDPLAAALQGLIARKEYGRHFLVGWEGEPPAWNEPFSFDASRI
jgi:hypothetical protein